MDLLASIIKSINKGDQCGSSIIDLLYDKVLAYSGDPKLQELLFYLAQTVNGSIGFLFFFLTFLTSYFNYLRQLNHI